MEAVAAGAVVPLHVMVYVVARMGVTCAVTAAGLPTAFAPFQSLAEGEADAVQELALEEDHVRVMGELPCV